MVHSACWGKSGVGSSFWEIRCQFIILARKDEPTSRENSGEEDSQSLKPFRWNPAGNQSRPVEPDQQPEASLAWWVGDHPCGKSGVSSSFLPEKTNRHRARSSGEEDSQSLKPIRWNPAGNQSRPVEPDQQPEASLAWWVGDHPCEA